MLEKRPRIIVEKEPKLEWNGQQAGKDETYGTKKHNEIENIPTEHLEKSAEANFKYEGVSDEQLLDRFYAARERMKSNVLMDSHLGRDLSDYKENYQQISTELERRGVSISAAAPEKDFSFAEDEEKFSKNLEDMLEKNTKAVEQRELEFRLGHNKLAFRALEQDAKDAFENMNFFEKGSPAHTAAKEEWQIAKQNVVKYETASQKYQDWTNDELFDAYKKSNDMVEAGHALDDLKEQVESMRIVLSNRGVSLENQSELRNPENVLTNESDSSNKKIAA